MKTTDFYEGQDVQYRWTKTGKWHIGRIKKNDYPHIVPPTSQYSENQLFRF